MSGSVGCDTAFLAAWTTAADAAFHWRVTTRCALSRLHQMRRDGLVERRDCWKSFAGGDAPRCFYYEFRLLRKRRRRRRRRSV